MFPQQAAMTLPTYSRSKGYSAGGAARYGNVAGIEGEPTVREVKKNSKSEICNGCGEMIAIKAGMHGWVATMMIQKSTCSHVLKNETLWYHISCCPESDPRMPQELARREMEERKMAREEARIKKEEARREKEERKRKREAEA